MRVAAFVVVTLAAASAAACSSSSSNGSGAGGDGGAGGGGLRASDYDRSCATTTDCAAVHEGDPCGGCSCANATIAAKDEARYEADLKAAQQACAPHAVCNIACAMPLYGCVAGTCSLCTTSPCPGGGVDAGAD